MIVLTNFWVFQKVSYRSNIFLFRLFPYAQKEFGKTSGYLSPLLFYFSMLIWVECYSRLFRYSSLWLPFSIICCKSSTIKILQIRLTTILSDADRSPVISSCLNGTCLVDMKMNLQFWRIASSLYVRNTWKAFCSVFGVL